MPGGGGEAAHSEVDMAIAPPTGSGRGKIGLWGQEAFHSHLLSAFAEGHCTMSLTASLIRGTATFECGGSW